VILVAPGSVPKTTSGKLRRGETKRLVSLSRFHLKGGGWAEDGY